ncbi:hypothetical protein [Duganella sp. S19_KUP01_CR8]|uniref:hypothetical protein n=1 Tax=Duganella sp. S19_KUP01_CR8 TaxID=3025502 RepID=UPI002FCDC9B1
MMPHHSTSTVQTTTDTGQQNPQQVVVHVGGNVHGFGTPAPQGPQTTGPGQALGHGSPNAGGLTGQLHRERMERARLLQQQQTQQPTQQQAPLPPISDVVTATALADPGSDIGAQRQELLAAMCTLMRMSQDMALSGLDGVMRQINELQARINALERGTLTLRLAPGGGMRVAGSGGPPGVPPPGGGLTGVERDTRLPLQLRLGGNGMRVATGGAPPDPPPGGSQTSVADEVPIRRVLRVRPATQRFLAARAALQAFQQSLLQGQQDRSARRERVESARRAVDAQLQPTPGPGWRRLTQQRANFLNAVAALTNRPPPVQPTANWRNLMQRHANFQAALLNLIANPPPLLPTLGWMNLIQQVNNFQNALHALTLNPPLPLLQPPIANNANHAPAPYYVPGWRAIHILHGDHTGGQHLGMYNPALHGAPPNAVTNHAWPGHFVTYFPVAWDADDVLAAMIEAAHATYHLAVQQGNGNWLHPPVQVSRRGITIWITVVTRANMHGLTVHTGWA